MQSKSLDSGQIEILKHATFEGKSPQGFSSA